MCQPIVTIKSEQLVSKWNSSTDITKILFTKFVNKNSLFPQFIETLKYWVEVY